MSPKKKLPKYPLKRGGFIIKGYNDRPKPCLREECDGMVEPTWNANVGKCNKCGDRFNWSDFVKS